MIDRATLFKAIDALVGGLLCQILGNLNFWFRRRTSIPDVKPDNIRRILVIRPGGMGDMIILLPVLKTLQEEFPNAIIELVCERRNMDVLKLAGLERDGVAYDSHPLRFFLMLARQRYDVVIDTEQFHHFSAVFAFVCGAPVRIGFKINPRRNPLYTHLVNYAPDGPEGLQFMRLLAPLGITGKEYKLEGFLSKFNAPPPAPIAEELDQGMEPFALIHPGAGSPYKLWQPYKLTELGRLLRQRHQLGIVLAGGMNDRHIGDLILRGMKDAGCRAVSYAGKLSLSATAAVIKRARLFVGSDSGLAHLAVAMGIPTVVLFGPSDHLKWGFQGPKHAIAHKNLPCSPCFIFGYHKPCRAIACMKSINVEDVMAACDEVLSR